MDNLFSSLQLRSLTLKNRIALSPMQQYSAVDGVPGNWHLVHLGSRAVGGAALIITECTAVNPEGRNTLSDVGIWNDLQMEAWKPIVDFIHQQDTKAAIQLWHAGGKSSHKHPKDGMKPLPQTESGWLPKSASAIEIDGHMTEELTIEEIVQIKKDFVAAARRAVRAGFDCIELHAAHGYLFHQFYTELINSRTDQYGGSFENRIRLLVEVVEDVRAAIPATMPLMVRMSATDYVDNVLGWKPDDSIRLASVLKDNGVDLVTASGGGFTQVSQSIVSPGYQVPLATSIKNNADILTGAVGMITDANQANDIIMSGAADLVVIAREHLRDPYFAINAAIALGEKAPVPWQYKRAF